MNLFCRGAVQAVSGRGRYACICVRAAGHARRARNTIPTFLSGLALDVPGTVDVGTSGGQGCFVCVELLVRHVVHLQQLPTQRTVLPRGGAGNADDDLTLQDHTPDPVALKGLPIWSGSNPAAHAMAGRQVAHDRLWAPDTLRKRNEAYY